MAGHHDCPDPTLEARQPTLAMFGGGKQGIHMASVDFSPEREKPALDLALEQAGTIAQTKPIRFRVQPDLYDYDRQRYQPWAGLIWTVDLEDVEEGRRLREGLTRFFRLFGRTAEMQAEVLRVLEEMEETL